MNKKLLIGLTFVFLSTSSYAMDKIKPIENYSATYNIYKIKDGTKSLITSTSSLIMENQETPVQVKKEVGNELSLAEEGFQMITDITNKNGKETWNMKGTVTSINSVYIDKDKNWSKVVSETIGFRHSMVLNKSKKTEFTSTFEQDGTKYVLESSVTRLK